MTGPDHDDVVLLGHERNLRRIRAEARCWPARRGWRAGNSLELDLAERSDSGHLGGLDRELRPVHPDPELHAAAHVVVPRTLGWIVDPDVEQVHPSLVLRIEPADVGPGTLGIEHHGDSVQLVPVGMERTPRESVAHTATPKNLSKAWVSSPALGCGDRPSIMWRCTKC